MLEERNETYQSGQDFADEVFKMLEDSSVDLDEPMRLNYYIFLPSEESAELCATELANELELEAESFHADEEDDEAAGEDDEADDDGDFDDEEDEGDEDDEEDDGDDSAEDADAGVDAGSEADDEEEEDDEDEDDDGAEQGDDPDSDADDDEPMWVCHAWQDGVTSRERVEAVGAKCIELAARHEGQFDGWDAEPVPDCTPLGVGVRYGKFDYSDELAVLIHGKVDPIDRSKLEEPLGEFLAKHNLGEVVGAETLMDGACKIIVGTNDPDRLRAEVDAALEQLGFPAGSAVADYEFPGGVDDEAEGQDDDELKKG